MAKTAKFRHVGPGGYVAIGFNGFTKVETDTVIDLPDDDVAVRAYKSNDGNGNEIVRSAQTTADCYRGQPDMWEEIPDIKPTKTNPEEGK